MTKTVAEYTVHYTQMINESGEACCELPSFATDKDLMLFLYKTMLLARTFDKKAIAMQRTGKIGTYAPINGQEAIGTAIGAVMHPDDVLIPYYRDYAAQLQRNIPLADILSFWGGDEQGSNFSENKQDLPMCVPIASQCLHAAGVAFALQYKKSSNAALVCIGDGGTSEGDFYEAINVAGLWKLPLVFIVNNNQWAISVARDSQTAAKTIAQKAIAAGFEGQQVDGNDVVALYDCIQKAMDKAKNGLGPTLIEAMTYRLCDHTTADDAARYQPQEKVDEAKKKEPLIRFRKYLQQNNWLSSELEQSIQQDCNTIVEKAVAEFNNRKKPLVTDMFDYHYATLPDYLIEQRATAVEELDNA